MAATLTIQHATRLYRMGLLTEEEYQHYQRIAAWRRLLRAGANTTTPRKEA